MSLAPLVLGEHNCIAESDKKCQALCIQKTTLSSLTMRGKWGRGSNPRGGTKISQETFVVG